MTTVTTLLPESTNTLNLTTCDPLQAGTTIDTLVAFNGCDSILTTVTTLLPESINTLNLTTCDPLQALVDTGSLQWL
ncbi:MAG: hypothetical protein R2730_12595 [Chitinophagales bacterium]